MTTSLRRLLEQEAERTRRSPAPLEDIMAGGASVVHRRRLVGIAVAAAVATVAVVVPWAILTADSDTDQPIEAPPCELPYLTGNGSSGGSSGLGVASPDLSEISEFLPEYGKGSVAYDPAFSPDGSRIAYEEFVDSAAGVTVRSAITLVDVQSGAQQRVTGDERSAESPAWSPDGSRIAYTSNRYRPAPHGGWGPGRLHIVNADGTGQRTIQLAPGLDAPRIASWPRDDTMLYVEDGTVWRINPEAPPPITPERVGAIEGWSKESELRFSPDGRTVVVSIPRGDEPEHLEIIDLDSGRTQSIPESDLPSWGTLRVLGWTSDDQLLFGRNVKSSDKNVFEIFEVWAVSDAGWGDARQIVSADADRIDDLPYEVNPTCPAPK